MRIAEIEVPVRYAETDQMGVVYHANYLIWFELGRTKLVEELGFHYAEMEKKGYISPVVDVEVSYKRPFRYGQTATVRTWVHHYDSIRTQYAYEVVNEAGDVCVIGKTSHVVLKKDTFRPISMKRDFPDWHRAYDGQANANQ